MATNHGGSSETALVEASEPGGHLHKVFYHVGFNDEEIDVPLSGVYFFGKSSKAFVFNFQFVTLD
jgi:hypothetical protein